MSSNARIFLAGVLTTFVILAAGFGGGLMLAQSALKEPSGYQSRASFEQATPVRVILPASAQPAQPPQTSTAPEPQPLKEVQAPVEKQVENVDARKAEAAEQRRKRYAERKSKKMAARARQQMEQVHHRPEPGILAFGGDVPHTGGFSGN